MTDHNEAATLAGTDAKVGREVPWPPRPGQRGLSAPYPPGGLDPDPDGGQREERRYLKLLVAMILAIVLGGFGVSILGVLLGFAGGDAIH